MNNARQTISDRKTQKESDRRGEHRESTCTRCELWVFNAEGGKSRVDDVVTRNSSFCGVSVVAKLPKPMRIGQPMEAIFASQGKRRTHVAGTVAFCRPVNGDYYEIGLHVKAAGPNQILVGEPQSVKARYDWFDEALKLVEPK